MTKLTQPLKYSGGKRYLAPHVLSIMKPHLHYVEAFAGGLSVLLQRDPHDKRLLIPGQAGVSELVNDIDGQLTNFWRVLQNEELFLKFRRRVEAIPMSRAEFDDAEPEVGDEVDRAVGYFVRARQSFSGIGKTFTAPTRTRLRRGINGNVSEWLGAVDGLPAVHNRLKRVFVESMDAIKLIPREDTQNTCFYLDPPYLHSTRNSRDLYRNEMTDDQHQQFLAACLKCCGQVIISGYDNEMYRDMLILWKAIKVEIANHMSGGKRRAVEMIWCNR